MPVQQSTLRINTVRSTAQRIKIKLINHSLSRLLTGNNKHIFVERMQVVTYHYMHFCFINFVRISQPGLALKCDASSARNTLTKLPLFLAIIMSNLEAVFLVVIVFLRYLTHIVACWDAASE